MDIKEQIRLDRIKLSIRSRLLDIGVQYKTVVRDKIPGATDAEFEQALQWLVEHNLVEIRAGNRGAEILAVVTEA
jgi:hypothetical protein